MQKLYEHIGKNLYQSMFSAVIALGNVPLVISLVLEQWELGPIRVWPDLEWDCNGYSNGKLRTMNV
jgi:hypothetical protein